MPQYAYGSKWSYFGDGSPVSLVFSPFSRDIQRELHGPQSSLGSTTEQHTPGVRH